jgi:outer membrane protein assembly factor BamB
MYRTIFLLILAQGLFCSCEKDFLVPTPPKPGEGVKSKLNIVWQKPLMADTFGDVFGVPHVLWQGNVVYSTSYSNPTFIQMITHRGEKTWRFDKFLKPIDFNKFGNAFRIQDHIIVHDWYETHCIDLKTGQLLWTDDIRPEGNGVPFANKIENNIYTVHHSGGKPYAKQDYLVRTDYRNKQWDTLLTITARDSFHPFIKNPTLWVNPKGDSVLIIRCAFVQHVYAIKQGIKSERVNLYAFNLRTQKMDWVMEDMEPDGVVADGELCIDGDRLYLNGPHTLHCIDLKQGKIQWQQKFKFILGCTVVRHKDIVVVQGDEYGMWGVDKHTGNTRWFQPDTDGNANELTMFDGIVYYTSTGYGRLYAVDAETGALLWSEGSPNRDRRHPDASFAHAGIVIDPERRVLYTADKFYIMCLKLAR